MRADDLPDAPLPESDYRITLTRLGGPADHEQVYWHLYYRDEKVNGGIAESRDLAFAEARNRKFRHSRDEWRRRYIWDETSARWYLRSEFSS